MPAPEIPATPRRLPGVGSSLEVRDTSARRVSVVRLIDGTAELYVEGDQVAELGAGHARTLGAFMSGHYRAGHELAERLDDALGGVTLDWVGIQPAWFAVGQSIEQLAVRRVTGVTIVAILRGSLPIIAPDAGTRLQAGDEVVVICRESDLDPFRRYLEGGR